MLVVNVAAVGAITLVAAVVVEAFIIAPFFGTAYEVKGEEWISWIAVFIKVSSGTTEKR